MPRAHARTRCRVRACLIALTASLLAAIVPTPLHAGELARPVPDNAQVTRFTRFNIRYTLRDIIADGVQKVEFYISDDMGATWRLYGEDVDRTSPMTIEVPGEGAYGFVCVATDRYGNRERAPGPRTRPETVIVVDRTPPEARWLAPRSDILGRGQPVEFQWETSDQFFSDTPVKIQFAANAQSNHDRNADWQILTENLPATGSYTWNPPTGAAYNFRLVAEDRAGNVTVAYCPATVRVDTTPSYITSVQPLRSNSLENNIVVDAHDGDGGSGVKEYSLYVSDNSAYTWTLVKEAGVGGETVPVKRQAGEAVAWTAPRSGEYPLWPVVFDNAGNATPLPAVGVQGNYILVIDNEPPVVTLSNSFLMGRMAVLANEQRRVEWTAYDPHIVHSSGRIMLSLDNGLTWQELRSGLPSSGSELINFPFGAQSEEARLKVTVEDEFGNIGEGVSETFKLTAAETAIESVTPRPGSGPSNPAPTMPTPTTPGGWGFPTQPSFPDGGTGLDPLAAPVGQPSLSSTYSNESTASSMPRAMLREGPQQPAGPFGQQSNIPSTTPGGGLFVPPPAGGLFGPADQAPPSPFGPTSTGAAPSAPQPGIGWNPSPNAQAGAQAQPGSPLSGWQSSGATSQPTYEQPYQQQPADPFQQQGGALSGLSGITPPGSTGSFPPSTDTSFGGAPASQFPTAPGGSSFPGSTGGSVFPSDFGQTGQAAATGPGGFIPSVPGGTSSPTAPSMTASTGTPSTPAATTTPLGSGDSFGTPAATGPVATGSDWSAGGFAPPPVASAEVPAGPGIDAATSDLGLSLDGLGGNVNLSNIPAPGTGVGGTSGLTPPPTGLRPPGTGTTETPATTTDLASSAGAAGGTQSGFGTPPVLSTPDPVQPTTRQTNPRQLSDHYVKESQTFREQGRPDLALDSAQKALDADNTNPGAYMELSQVNARKDPPDFVRAANLAKESTTLQADWETWWNCADVFYIWAHATNREIQAMHRTGQTPLTSLVEERNSTLQNALIAINNAASVVSPNDRYAAKKVAVTQGMISYLRALTIPEPVNPGEGALGYDEYIRQRNSYKAMVTPLLVEAMPFFQNAINLGGAPEYNETFQMGIINFRLAGLERDTGNTAQATTYYQEAARWLEEATTSRNTPTEGPREAYYMLALCHDQLSSQPGSNRARHRELALRYWRQTADFYEPGSPYRIYAEQRIEALAEEMGF